MAVGKLVVQGDPDFGRIFGGGVDRVRDLGAGRVAVDVAGLGPGKGIDEALEPFGRIDPEAAEKDRSMSVQMLVDLLPVRSDDAAEVTWFGPVRGKPEVRKRGERHGRQGSCSLCGGSVFVRCGDAGVA